MVATNAAVAPWANRFFLLPPFPRNYSQDSGMITAALALSKGGPRKKWGESTDSLFLSDLLSSRIQPHF